MNSGRPKILWGITGSVAGIRAAALATALAEVGELKAMATPRALHFLHDFPADIPLLRDRDEWTSWRELGDPVLHIELRRQASLLLIAPCSADALAKLAAGISDNLVLSVARAWDFRLPFLIAPAMNTLMWTHPATAGHLATLRSWGVRIIEPVEKKLACDDVGIGGLAAAETIATAVRAALDR